MVAHQDHPSALRSLRMKLKLPISLYDVQGLVFGSVMASLGVLFLKSAELVTGQTAGLAVLLSYITPLSFGALFLMISLPFFYISLKRRGLEFTLRTIFAVVSISFFSHFLVEWVSFSHLPPLLAAILAGCCAGVGLIALFRHNASAGGLGILALIVEEKTGFKTGWFQLCFDAVVFGIALFALPFESVVYSFIGALILNMTIAWNFHISQARRVPAAE